MLRAHLFFSITAPAALLALVAQPLVEHSLVAVAGPAKSEVHLVKGDRLAPGRPVAGQQVPVAVEITGLGAARITLRGASGEVLYQTDAAANTTLVARDTALPNVTLRSREGAPVAVRAPAQPAETAGPRRMMPEGCEGAISGLAGLEARRLLPSRCLAQAEPAALAG